MSSILAKKIKIWFLKSTSNPVFLFAVPQSALRKPFPTKKGWKSGRPIRGFCSTHRIRTGWIQETVQSMQTDETKRLEESKENPLHEEPCCQKRNFKGPAGKLTMKRQNDWEGFIGQMIQGSMRTIRSGHVCWSFSMAAERQKGLAFPEEMSALSFCRKIMK